MCKKLFFGFLHLYIFNLNQLSKDKIEPIEPKLDFSLLLSHLFLSVLSYPSFSLSFGGPALSLSFLKLTKGFFLTYVRFICLSIPSIMGVIFIPEFLCLTSIICILIPILILVLRLFVNYIEAKLHLILVDQASSYCHQI